jgi:hypothetical protein
MSEAHRHGGRVAHLDDVRASVAAAGCLLRGMPLFFRATPRTPLRVLGIVALDTLHVLRHSRRMSPRTIGQLARFLDFEGCANAAWDRKAVCAAEYDAHRHWLERAGLGTCLDEYLRRLRDLESRRPSSGGGRGGCDDVRAYREAVARLAIAAPVAIALYDDRLDDGVEATHRDCDVETLFRILMLCQILDDVLDYGDDASAGLPSFLTAASLPQAVAAAAGAARSYASRRGPAAGVLPFRIALRLLTAVTAIAVRAAGLGYESFPRVGPARDASPGTQAPTFQAADAKK